MYALFVAAVQKYNIYLDWTNKSRKNATPHRQHLSLRPPTTRYFSCLPIHSMHSSLVSGKRQWPLVGVTASVLSAVMTL